MPILAHKGKRLKAKGKYIVIPAAVIDTSFKLQLITTTPDQSVTIPHLSGYDYNYTVDYGDNSPLGTVTSYNDGDCTHVYTTPGTYVMKILGTCETFYTDGSGTMKDVITQVLQWSNTVLKRINLGGCSNLTEVATDTASGLTLVTDFTNMFSVCSSFSSIPSGLFDYAVNATNFYGTFQYTPISSIPSGLFDN